MTEKTLRVPDMHCGHCKAAVEGELHKLSGVQRANADIENILGEKVDEWLQQNVGIKERHVMADDQATSDLCVAAARQVFA